MVIAAISVFSHLIGLGGLQPARIIIEQDDNYRFGTRNQERGMGAFVEVIFHIRHVCMHAFVQPMLKVFGIVGEVAGRCNATLGKAQFLGYSLNILGNSYNFV